MSRTIRGAAVLGAALSGVIAFALPASAHVTVAPPTAVAGAYTTLMFQVPTERDDASTTKVDVQFPSDAPIASVLIKNFPGWTYEVKKVKLDKPITTDDGTISEGVSEIIWTASSGDTAIKSGEFAQFVISAGPLPDKPGALAFKTLQTYSDGQVVRWIDIAQPGQAEPEHPAPTLTLTAASTDSTDAHGGSAATTTTSSGTTSSGTGTSGTGTSGTGPSSATAMQAASQSTDSSDGTARALGIAGLVVGIAGIGFGAFALRSGRRRSTTP
ncbi:MULTISPECIES: YcnI family protein [unclassified Frankia]|uniref:YcnI family copper-binding membrane protein n=1 Tax=unclassified Frankia TaxID=2632575 RepID=UPI002AD42BD9|nr:MULTISPECIES: YcnI family protein [unclassified Frankia]